jgi:hypothetical protein
VVKKWCKVVDKFITVLITTAHPLFVQKGRQV